MILAAVFAVSFLSVVMCDSPGTHIESTTQSINRTSPGNTTESTSPLAPTTTLGPRNKTDHWIVYFTDHERFCLIMDAAISIAVMKPTGSMYVQIEKNATVDGSCSTSEDNIILRQKDMKLTLWFSRNNATNTYNMSRIALEYKNWTELNTTQTPQLLNNLDDSKGYTCSKNVTLYSGGGQENDTIQITMAQLQMNVFQNSTHPEFLPTAGSCDNNTDNLIPIIVGAALGGLIIIVLVAYLIGRHRSRRGYESV